MEFIIVLIASILIVTAIAQVGADAPVVAHNHAMRHQGGSKVAVNVNGHKVRTIIVKAHTRTVGA